MASGPSPSQRATVADEPDAGRYVIELDGTRVGFLNYRLAGGEMTMVHAEVEPAHGRQGLGSQLVRGALNDARARELRVRPLCPFVAGFVARHRDEYDDVVA